MTGYRGIDLAFRWVTGIAVAVAILLTGAGTAAQSVAPGDWTQVGSSWRQDYYSPLSDITPANIDRLAVAWTHELPAHWTFEATPLVVDGVLYVSGLGGRVFAVNAETGSALWTFSPSDTGLEPEPARSCCGPVNRGVALAQGKLFVGSFSGILFALDPATGRMLWHADTIVDRNRAYTSTGAPYVAGDVVVIGNGGSELDARGYVSAYYIATGKLAWRFFTVPGDPKKGFEHPELKWAAKTWDPNSAWEAGLGGTVWDGMAYDPELKLLYVGTGNAVPYPKRYRSPRGGDNLFLSSILAINPATGRLVWHYQTTPGDIWDYTATQKMILADMQWEGKPRKLLMQAPKNGFFYVLDRQTGKLLSAKPYLRKLNWASHVDMKTGRPVLTAQSDYSKGPKLIFPVEQGGHNWHPMAYDPVAERVYLPVREAGAIYAEQAGPYVYRPGQTGTWHYHVSATADGRFPIDREEFKNWPPLAEILAGQPNPTPQTFLRAFNPRTGQIDWEIDTTTINQNYVSWAGGVMATAGGLVFQGRADGQFHAVDAKSGKVLKSWALGQGAIVAAPMSYRIGSTQYIAVMMARGRGDSKTPGYIVTMKLDVAPSNVEKPTAAAVAPGVAPLLKRADAATLARGRTLYADNCAVCHSGGRAPSLLPPSATARAEFMDIVMKGSRGDEGMMAFNEILTVEDARAIEAYLLASGDTKQ